MHGAPLTSWNEEYENPISTSASAQNGTKCPLRHSSLTERGESTMTYDPNNANDPNRPLNPNLDLRTTPSARSNNTWVVWAAALAVIAVAAFAYSQWSTPAHPRTRQLPRPNPSRRRPSRSLRPTTALRPHRPHRRLPRHSNNRCSARRSRPSAGFLPAASS